MSEFDLYPEQYPGLVGMNVTHIVSGALRSIVAYRQRGDDVVIQLSQVIKFSGETIYNVFTSECYAEESP